MPTRKNNRKGFTLIEVLGVFVLLGVIALIAIPVVTVQQQRTHQAYYDSLERIVKIAAQDYYGDNRGLIPITNGASSVVELATLVSRNYLEQPVSVKKNSCTGYVRVAREDQLSYQVCLKCDDYENDHTCNFTDRPTGENPSRYLSISPTYYEVPLGDPFIVPYASYYVNGSLERNDIAGAPSWIDTSVLTTYTITYTYMDVEPVTITVKIQDTVPPSATTVTMHRDSLTGSIYSSESGWTKSDIYQVFSATDNEGGSGIAGYEYSFSNQPNNSSVWTFTTNHYITQKELITKQGIGGNDFTGTVYVRAVDVDGNRGPVTSYSLSVDQTGPACNVTGGTSSWLASQTITGTCSDFGSGCPSNSTVSKTFNTETVNGNESPGTIQDNVGNTTTCPTVRVMVDKTNPSCNSSGGRSTWGTSQYIYGYCTDNESGCDPSTDPLSKYISSTTNSYVSPGTVRDRVGNTASCPTVSVKVDNSNPSTPSISGATSSCQYKDSWSITLTSSDSGSGVSYFEVDEDYDGISERTVSSSNGQSATFRPPSNYDHDRVRFRAVDSAGNKSSWSSYVCMKVDSSAPSLSVTMQTSSGTYSGSWTNQTVTVTMNGTDDESDIDYYQYYDGSSWRTTTSRTITISSNTNDTYQFRAYDEAGNVSNTVSKTIRIDKTAPTCSTSGGSTSWKTSGSVTITGRCSDSGGSGCVSTTVSETYSGDRNGSYSPGTVRDNAGNTRVCGNETIRIDTTAPSTPSVSGAGSCTNQSSITIRLSSSENVSGISYYEIDTNGDGTADHTNISSTWSPWDGFYTDQARFRAVNGAGLRSGWSGNYCVMKNVKIYIVNGSSAPYGGVSMSNTDGGPSAQATHINSGGWYIGGNKRLQSTLTGYVSFPKGLTQMCFKITQNEGFVGTSSNGYVGWTNRRDWLHNANVNGIVTKYTTLPRNSTGTYCVSLSGSGGYPAIQLLQDPTSLNIAHLDAQQVWMQ